MGGAAINAIIATGAAGGGVTALATAVAAGQSGTLDVDELMKKFREVYRRGTTRMLEGTGRQNNQRSMELLRLLQRFCNHTSSNSEFL